MPSLLPCALNVLLALQPLSTPPPPLPVPPLPGLPVPGLPAPPEPPIAPKPVGQPRSAAGIALEAAIRARLFDGPASPGRPDPDSTEWQQARTQGLRPRCGEVGPLRYLSRAVDLDGDGRSEQVVAVLGSYACGSRGCTLLVFRQAGSAEAGNLQPLAELDLFQAPLSVSSRRQAGWRELLLPAPLEQGQPVRLVWQPQRSRYDVAPGPADPSLPEATLTPLLEMEALPFEQLGQPLPCDR